MNHKDVFCLFGELWRNHGLLLNPDNEETVGTKTCLALWEYHQLTIIFQIHFMGGDYGSPVTMKKFWKENIVNEIKQNEQIMNGGGGIMK